MPLGDEENMGEQWCNKENSQAERQSLFCLERELDVTLQSEHGDDPGSGLKAS